MHDPLRYRDAYHAALETAAPSEAERTWRRNRFDRGLRLVAELRRRHALAVEGLPILDMGMAHGGDCAAFASEGARVTGLDYSDLGMKALRDALAPLAPLDSLRADLNAPFPLAAETFDGALSLCVIEHIIDLDAHFHECHRILRPGGWLFLITPMALRFFYKDPHFGVPFTSLLPMGLRKFVCQRLLRRRYPYPLADHTFYTVDSIGRAAGRQGFRTSGHVFADREFMSTLGGLPGGGLASRALEYFVPDYILLVRD
ncbi:MAG: class I SAM-dependent methyltransferase [Myxococcota bacterium]